MATRAYVAENPEQLPVEFLGSQVGHLAQVMHSERKFIANLHGNIDDSSSWIFTHSSLKELRSKTFYNDFLRTCLSSFTNLFIGMTIDDIAVGSHLKSLSKLNIEAPSHFWLTDRGDFRTDEWAEKVGVRLIKYRPDSNHSQVLEFLKDLIASTPNDPHPIPPLAFSGLPINTTETLLSPEEMLSLNAEDIRYILNQEAVRILSPENDQAYNEYEAFVQKYDEAIFRAWYTSDKDGRNQLLGHKLKQQVALGAFGRVYEAETADGRKVAIKVLLENIRRDPGLLRSFRRGVRSMRILQERHVDGMVAYETTSEIPAFVTMEWIEGPNLTEAKDARALEDWEDVLFISKELTSIIRNAHSLPDRVLHRDIRPSNVMLRDYWIDPSNYKVAVLDFDLSWHRGAQELSVLHTTAVGYLAPEQILASSDGSTRNAAVDAFGIGMTIYYICGGTEPLPELHQHANYADLVEKATRSLTSSSWKSLPERMKRLIISSTRHRQSERWDLSQIVAELERLQAAHSGSISHITTEMLVEELAARSITFAKYEWNTDTNSASYQLPTGLLLQLSADEPNANVSLRISWARTGIEQRAGMSKYVIKATRTLADQLKSAHWKIVTEKHEAQSMTIQATKNRQSILQDIDHEAEILDATLQGLKFAE
ncbi:protein kinase [Amycolatopsis sp. 195334CR]|nr:protein kinase [Amycolatopsis sp. 195334CR]